MVFEDAGTRTVTKRAMGAEMLDAETELALARAWRDHGDEKALHRLVNAYMRLAVSMASRYRRYGAPMQYKCSRPRRKISWPTIAAEASNRSSSALVAIIFTSFLSPTFSNFPCSMTIVVPSRLVK